MFEITANKGFHMTFANGYAISVQWGASNYCDNRGDWRGEGAPVPPSNDAEIAILAPGGGFHRPSGWHDDVRGWCSADDVAHWIAYTIAL